MAIKQRLNWLDCLHYLKKHNIDREGIKVYGVPRGGMCASNLLKFASIVYESPADADVILDDIVDSGQTRDKYLKQYPNKSFCAIIDKTSADVEMQIYKDKWIVFPWENERTEEDIVLRLLQYIGEDVSRQGLRETPKRVMKAWAEWTSGYSKSPSDVLKTFEDGAEQSDQMITVHDIPIWSHCEHHLAPFFGKAKISYIPNGRIVGLSKFARLADMFARRLQVQERLTNQIADALQETLNPIGIGVEIKCRHLCMESRGVKTHNSSTKTIALRGAIKECEKARYEFLSN